MHATERSNSESALPRLWIAFNMRLLPAKSREMNFPGDNCSIKILKCVLKCTNASGE